MAQRAAVIVERPTCVDDCARVTAPTLIVTGEREPRSGRAGRRHARVPAADCRRAARDARADRTSRIDHEAGRVRGAGARVRRRDAPGPDRTRPTAGHPVPLREIAGPAGRLEALLDEPATRDRACAPPSSSRIRIRSTAARCTPRWSIRPPRRSVGSAAPCCASIFAASGRARARFDRRHRRGGRFSRRRSISCTSAIRRRALVERRVLVRRVDRADGRRRRSAGVDAHRHRAAAGALRLRDRARRARRRSSSSRANSTRSAR